MSVRVKNRNRRVIGMHEHDRQASGGLAEIVFVAWCSDGGV